MPRFSPHIFAATAAAEMCSNKVYCTAEDRQVWLPVVCRSQPQRLCRTAGLSQLRCWEPCRLPAHLQPASRALSIMAAARGSRQQQQSQQESWTIHSRVYSKDQLGGETAQMGLLCHLSRQALGAVLSMLCRLRGSLLDWRPATQSSAAPQEQFLRLQAGRRCTRRQRRPRRNLQRRLLPQGPSLLQQLSCRAQLQREPRRSSLSLASSTTAAALSVT